MTDRKIIDENYELDKNKNEFELVQDCFDHTNIKIDVT